MPTSFDFSGQCRARLLATTGGVVAMTLAAVPAHAGGATAQAKPTLSYFLPRTDLHVTTSQRLVRCPAEKRSAEVETTITVTAERAADLGARVVLDARSGVFAKRTVKLELNPDQTLSAFNSTAEGQGGPILKSIGKLAFKLGAGAFGGPATAGVDEGAQPVTCTDDVIQAFNQLGTLQTQIADLEKLIAEGKGNPAATALLSDWRARRSQIREGLTLTTRTTVRDASGPHQLTAPDYTRWFAGGGAVRLVRGSTPAVPGALGFQIRVTPDAGSIIRSAGSVSRSYGSPTSPVKDLVYRLPVGASIAVTPCASAWNDGTGCEPLTTHAGEDASFAGRVALMHLSPDHFLSVGKGGLFGTRQAAAKFDPQGAPTMLEYGSSPGTADAAGVVDTLGEGLDTLRDAETEALKRAIAKEEARKKLNELREAAANPE